MLIATAVTPIWDEATGETIEQGKEFKMSDDRVMSLINIGAAKLKVDKSKEGSDEDKEN